MNDTWYSEIESNILTQIQYVLTEKLDAPFPELNCTTSSQNDTIEGVAVFPTLYIHLLPPVEMGNDLENVSVNAVRATFDFQVYSNKSEDECMKILSQCIAEMKRLHFNVPMFPDPQTNDKKYFAIARFSRVIGSGDSDIIQA